MTWSWGANAVLPPPGLFCSSASQERLSLGPSPEAGGTEVLPSRDLRVATGPLRGLSSGDKPQGQEWFGRGCRVGAGFWEAGPGAGSHPHSRGGAREAGLSSVLLGGTGSFTSPPARHSSLSLSLGRGVALAAWSECRSEAQMWVPPSSSSQLGGPGKSGHPSELQFSKLENRVTDVCLG